MNDRGSSPAGARRERPPGYWAERKAAQRARQPRPERPEEPSEEFIRLVFAEKKYRLEREYRMWNHPDLITHAYRYTQLEFSADVWVATVVLETQYGVGKASPTKIAGWLHKRGLNHGCAKDSLRSKVYGAKKKLERLGSEPYLYHRSEPVWPPFSLEEALGRQAGARD